MENTSLTLLTRLKAADDSEAWQRLFVLYQPLLIGWLRKYDVQPTDADDLVQEVLLTVSKNLCSFEHTGREGAFRSWLRTILANRLRNFWTPARCDAVSLDSLSLSIRCRLNHPDCVR